MATMKLFDSELKLMEIIWDKEPISAKEISRIAAEIIGWNKNTTNTVIKKLIDKKAVLRTEPDFICTSLIKKENIQSSETRNLIDKLYNGSKKKFFAAFLEKENLTEDEIAEIRSMIEKM